MAKKSAVQRDLKRRALMQRQAARRARLKSKARDRSAPTEERFAASVALAALPRNGAPSRVRNRCLLTGRPRGYYRKLRMSRVALRDLAAQGLIPGMAKASW